MCLGVSTPHAWENVTQTCSKAPVLRGLDASELESIIQDLRSHRMPWTTATESYVRRTLSELPCVSDDSPRHTVEALKASGSFTSFSGAAIHTFVVAVSTGGVATQNVDGRGKPFADHVRLTRTNIGTLDTTRVIERLMQ